MCEDCTTELVMVAKFREKCGMADIALEQLKKQINKIHRSETVERLQVEADIGNVDEPEQNSSEQFFESVEYAEENVEYVIYDSDFIDETDMHDKSPDEMQSSDEKSFECNEANENEVRYS